MVDNCVDLPGQLLEFATAFSAFNVPLLDPIERAAHLLESQLVEACLLLRFRLNVVWIIIEAGLRRWFVRLVAGEFEVRAGRAFV